MGALDAHNAMNDTLLVHARLWESLQEHRP
jgi:hypothetical protein